MIKYGSWSEVRFVEVVDNTTEEQYERPPAPHCEISRQGFVHPIMITHNGLRTKFVVVHAIEIDVMLKWEENLGSILLQAKADHAG